jgi:hypothetical protein
MLLEESLLLQIQYYHAILTVGDVAFYGGIGLRFADDRRLGSDLGFGAGFAGVFDGYHPVLGR